MRIKIMVPILCPLLLATAATAQVNPPCFRLVWRDTSGGFVQAKECDDTLTGWAQAAVTKLPNGHWQLDVTNEHSATGVLLAEVYFPWIAYNIGTGQEVCYTSPFALNGNPNDDVVLGTYIMGAATKLTRAVGYPAHPGQQPWSWMGWEYPGPDFSPVLIRTDGQSAELLAATNWDAAAGIEPRTVSPFWACNGWTLAYRQQDLDYQQSDRYRAMIVQSDGEPAGMEPWVDVALDYQAWLNEQLAANGLAVSYPQWMTDAHGFLDYQLENNVDGQAEAYTEAVWDLYKDDFPWAVFWGEMSDYADGCCTQCRTLHGRFDPGGVFDVRQFASQVRGENKHVAFYTAPFNRWDLTPPFRPQLTDDAVCIEPEDQISEISVPPYEPGEFEFYPTPYPDPSHPPEPVACPAFPDACPGGGTGETPWQWFQKWNDLAKNDWGPNSFYFDTFGGINWGPPVTVARLFEDPNVPGDEDTKLSRDTMIEWPIDVYPTAFLSGPAMNISAGYYPGGPGKSNLADIDDENDRISFPALAAVLLNDRYFFNGSLSRLWGLCHDYWAERQTFLLGNKFDVHWPYEKMSDCTAPGATCNPVIDACDAKAAKQYCGSSDFALIPGGFSAKLDCMDNALQLAVQARDAVDWWTKEPRYLHRAGLSQLGGLDGDCVLGIACSNDFRTSCTDDRECDVDVRRYVDTSGAQPADVVVIDNWYRLSGLTFLIDGREVPIPSDRLSILEQADLCTPLQLKCAGDTDCCQGVCGQDDTCCFAAGSSCSSNAECCSGKCKGNGKCR